jgi:replicative DNA helicase
MSVQTDARADAQPYDADPFDRIPPQDLDSEQSTLGGMLLSKNAIGEVTEVLRRGSEAFYKPAHQIIYEAILDLYGKGEPADPITVAGYLTKTGDINKIGGAAYLHSLVQTVPTAANAEYYAELVYEAAVARQLVEAGTRITQIGYQRRGEASELVDAAQAEVFGIAESATEDTLLHADVGMDATVDGIEAAGRLEKGELTGKPTGFKDLDELTNGFQDGQFIVVAGRPAMGKSTLALDFARAVAIENGGHAAYFSLEMNRTELQQRLLSAEGSVGLHKIRNGNMDDAAWSRVAQAKERVRKGGLYVDDAADLTMMSIRTKARRLKQQGKLDMVIVDYLQLMQMGTSRRAESRQQEVADMSRSMKLLAKELGIPVVALSQLNRGPEQRTEKKPMVSDLRESGAIEQDADVVILLHREDAYEKESPRAGEADIIVGKHRNGPTATITVAFQGHYSRFVDMART